ncbi:cupin domain-containing protein [Halobaculum sp. MBLA0147]|uniref:cupin domain-containing protein n=1 Tax=Halobaculum sp. MBLA0147 TaxID=3079934 RepID=UPI003523ADF0
MEHVAVDEVDNAVQPAAVMRRLTDELGCEDLAINYYELAPGDSFAFAYHEHSVQEEVFVVLSGTATWETESGTVTVGPNEAIRFGPGERQRGWNRTDEDGEGERVRALALGAPLSYGDQPKTAPCPECGEDAPVSIGRPDDDPEAVVTTCDDCGTEVGRWVRGDDGDNERVV